MIKFARFFRNVLDLDAYLKKKVCSVLNGSDKGKPHTKITFVKIRKQLCSLPHFANIDNHSMGAQSFLIDQGCLNGCHPKQTATQYQHQP